MKKKTLIVTVLALCAALIVVLSPSKPAPFGPLPSKNQLRWQAMEMYAFIHYSMNTYTDQ